MAYLPLIGTVIDVSLRLKGKDENLRGVTPENKVALGIPFVVLNSPTLSQASVMTFYAGSVFMSKTPVFLHQAVSLYLLRRIKTDTFSDCASRLHRNFCN